MQKPDDAKPARRAAPTAQQVADYLRRHPDFLAQHPELLNNATPGAPVRADGAVDMQHFLLKRAQGELRALQDAHADLVSTSRANLTSQKRIHQAALALLAAPGFPQLLEAVTTDLAVHLEVDAVALCVEAVEGAPNRVPMGGISILKPGTVDHLLGEGRVSLLRPYIAGSRALFGPAAGLVRSDALLRLDLGSHAPHGILAFGSRNEGRFQPGQGTDLLIFLAGILALAIRSWLDLPV